MTIEYTDIQQVKVGHGEFCIELQDSGFFKESLIFVVRHDINPWPTVQRVHPVEIDYTHDHDDNERGYYHLIHFPCSLLKIPEPDDGRIFAAVITNKEYVSGPLLARTNSAISIGLDDGKKFRSYNMTGSNNHMRSVVEGNHYLLYDRTIADALVNAKLALSLR